MISPEGDMLFPLNTNHTSEMVCEVNEGATPKWQLETAQITAPYDGVNTTTKGNVSSIFLTEQGLIPYMKNSTSGMVTVMCLEMHNNPGWIGSNAMDTTQIIYFSELNDSLYTVSITKCC